MFHLARVTVHIPDDLLNEAVKAYGESPEAGKFSPTVSGLVQASLRSLLDRPARAERSERGRLETLRAVRAAQVALHDVELTLVQEAPVRRRVRRV